VLICWMLGLRLALRGSAVAARHTTTTRARMCLRVEIASERAGGRPVIVVSYRIDRLQVKHLAVVPQCSAAAIPP
jgi:hypothetical protein